MNWFRKELSPHYLWLVALAIVIAAAVDVAPTPPDEVGSVLIETTEYEGAGATS